MEIKGSFRSLWENGEVVTPATLDSETGAITTESVAVGGLKPLMEESFEDSDGNEHAVCPNCHTHIMRSVMREGPFKTLEEVALCANPDCESNQEICCETQDY